MQIPLDYIIVYESQHHQALFPMSRLRAAWDLPTGLFAMRELLPLLFPNTEIIYHPLRFREFTLNNELLGLPTSLTDLSTDKIRNFVNIPDGARVLLMHSQWYDRELLLQLSSGQILPDSIFLTVQDVPYFAYFIFNEKISKNFWWQDLQRFDDPLPPDLLPSKHCYNYPWELLDIVPGNFEKDFSLFLQIEQKKQFTSPAFPNIIGLRSLMLKHKHAQISPGVILDTTNGPIVVADGARITAPSYIQGPIYIGAGSQIDGAKLRGESYIGQNCRIAGEVENSIVLDYSNKHHDGFLGHSVVGSWVNIGSLANTSDLKNNYGDIRIWNKGELISSGRIKLGSLFGDFAKVGIGIQINTGSVIDLAANIFTHNPTSKYLPPFLWGSSSEHPRYERDRFIADTKKVMLRRKRTMSPAVEKYLLNCYDLLC